QPEDVMLESHRMSGVPLVKETVERPRRKTRPIRPTPIGFWTAPSAGPRLGINEYELGLLEKEKLLVPAKRNRLGNYLYADADIERCAMMQKEGTLLRAAKRMPIAGLGLYTPKQAVKAFKRFREGASAQDLVIE